MPFYGNPCGAGSPFGSGADGALHISSDATMAQAEYNLASLQIDEGVTWSAPAWASDYKPVIIIRCKTTVVLNGVISATGVAAYMDGSGTINDNGTQYPGMPPTMLSDADGNEVIHAPVYPIPGGGARGGSYLFEARGDMGIGFVVGYTASSVAMYADGDSIWAGTLELADVIGPGRPWRYCAGCGGGGDDTGCHGGNGGGILLIYAPGIAFGTNAGIEVEGADGEPTDGIDPHCTAGGGGGYVEIATRAAIPDPDWAKISVAGGTGFDSATLHGGDGMAGLKRRIVLL